MRQGGGSSGRGHQPALACPHDFGSAWLPEADSFIHPTPAAAPSLVHYAALARSRGLPRPARPTLSIHLALIPLTHLRRACRSGWRAPCWGCRAGRTRSASRCASACGCGHALCVHVCVLAVTLHGGSPSARPPCAAAHFPPPPGIAQAEYLKEVEAKAKAVFKDFAQSSA